VRETAARERWVAGSEMVAGEKIDCRKGEVESEQIDVLCWQERKYWITYK
jgi:hypothetical protein